MRGSSIPGPSVWGWGEVHYRVSDSGKLRKAFRSVEISEYRRNAP